MLLLLSMLLLSFPPFVMTFSLGRHRMQIEGPDPIWSVDRVDPSSVFTPNHNRQPVAEPDYNVFSAGFDLHNPRRVDHPRIATTVDRVDPSSVFTPIHNRVQQQPVAEPDYNVFSAGFDLHTPRRVDHPRIATTRDEYSLSASSEDDAPDAPGVGVVADDVPVLPPEDFSNQRFVQRGRGGCGVAGGRGRGRGRGSRGGRGGYAQRRVVVAEQVPQASMLSEPVPVTRQRSQDDTADAQDANSDSSSSSSSSSHDQGLRARTRAPKFEPGLVEQNVIMFQLSTDVSTPIYICIYIYI
jgi:hypothetical protein